MSPRTDVRAGNAAPEAPLPRDVSKAVALLRRSVEQPVCMADLVRHCGVPERTLTKHFRDFLSLSPMQYLRRLRLTAAREILLKGGEVSVTDVAKRCRFNHFGRFAPPVSQMLRRIPFGNASSGASRVAGRAERTRS